MRNLVYAGVALLATAGLAQVPCANAGVINITTASGLLIDGHDNAGAWLSPETATQIADTNSNYITGFSSVLHGTARSFFSFDLSLLGTNHIAGLTLQIQRYGNNATNQASETVTFFDVSTDPVTLNHNGVFNSSVYADLGSGNTYGSVTLVGPGTASDIVSIALNAQAVADINTALNNYLNSPVTANRFFSIGADLTNNDGDDAVFTGSNLGNSPSVARPTLVVATPEPMTLVAFGFGLLGVAGFRRLRARG